MRPYSKADILTIYKRLVRIACDYANVRKWHKASDFLSSAASWAYQFNYFYRDDEAESLIKRISESQVMPVRITSPEENRIVLIDSFCFDNRGLTQQYLRAMIQNEAELLYICTATTLESGSDILSELGKYPKARTLLFGGEKVNSIEIANRVEEEVARYAPSHIFLHIAPWDMAALLACSAISGSTIYNINLTDHAFWLGASIIDYNIEFRPYGMTVSLEKRRLKPEQLLQQPFYPVAPISHPFKGFPQMPDDAVKVFTGGALYKILGKNDIFFRLMEAVLSISPHVYILIAGFDSSAIFDEKCSKVRGGDRILQLGFRDDIDAVFQECDIFLSTYPTSGGLMCQYAAKYKKPILAYRDADDVENAVEEMVNHYSNGCKSHTDFNQFLDYARELILDKVFRQHEGDAMHKGLMTAEAFAESFPRLVSSHTKQWDWSCDHIDYDAFSSHYLELENKNGFAATKALVSRGGLTLLLKLKGFRLQFLPCLLSAIRDVPLGRLPHIIGKRIGLFR